MILQKFIKQPADVKDYDIDYSEWLADGDAISTYEAVVECVEGTDDDTLVVDSQSATTSVLKTWLSGGTAGCTYKVSVTIVTTGGRTQQDEFKVKVKDY